MIHHTRSKMASSTSNNGNQPSKAEIARERSLLSISAKNKTRGNCDAKNISIQDRNISNIQKNVMFYSELSKSQYL